MKTNDLTLCFVNQSVSAFSIMTERQKVPGLKREVKVLKCHNWKKEKGTKEKGCDKLLKDSLPCSPNELIL